MSPWRTIWSWPRAQVAYQSHRGYGYRLGESFRQLMSASRAPSEYSQKSTGLWVGPARGYSLFARAKLFQEAKRHDCDGTFEGPTCHWACVQVLLHLFRRDDPSSGIISGFPGRRETSVPGFPRFYPFLCSTFQEGTIYELLLAIPRNEHQSRNSQRRPFPVHLPQ